jgi:hypothetical protein
MISSALKNVPPFLNNTGNALKQAKMRTHNDFFPGIIQFCIGNVYFMKMAMKFTI